MCKLIRMTMAKVTRRPTGWHVWFCVLLLSQHVTLSLAQEQSDGLDLVERYMSHYYVDPAPEQAPEMLELFLTQVLPAADPHVQENVGALQVVAYFFGRVAQGHENIVRHYEALMPVVEAQYRGFLLAVLRLCGDKSTRSALLGWLDQSEFPEHDAVITDVLGGMGMTGDSPVIDIVRTPKDLDLLWVEFSLTGEARPIEKILDVLDQPDRVRDRVMEWLARDRSEEEVARVVGLLEAIGISYDRSTNRVVTSGDLDVLSASHLQRTSMQSPQARPFMALSQLIHLGRADIVHIAIKGAAAWSLWSNAQTHPQLVAICEQQLDKRSGGSWHLLNGIVNTLSKH